MFDFLLAVRFPINLPDRFVSMPSVPFLSAFALAFLFKRKVSSQTSEPCLCWTIECQGCCGRYLMAKITSPSDVQQTSSLVDIGKYSKLKIDTNSILPFCMKLNIITEFKYVTVIGRWYEFTIFLSFAIHYIKPPISLYTMLKMWEIWGRTAQNNSSSQKISKSLCIVDDDTTTMLIAHYIMQRNRLPMVQQGKLTTPRGGWGRWGRVVGRWGLGVGGIFWYH